MAKKIYLILLALWFALWGLLSVSNFELAFSGPVLGLLALAVAVFAFLDR